MRVDKIRKTWGTFNLPSRRSFWVSASRFAIGLAYTRGPRCSDAVIGRATSGADTGGGTGVGAAATGAGAAGEGADGAAGPERKWEC